MHTVIASRRYFKAIVVMIVVALALYAYGASASSSPPLQATKGVPTVQTDPRFKDNDELPAPTPAPAVIPSGSALGTSTGYNARGYTGHYDSSGTFHATGNTNDGYTEVTRQKDTNGNIVKTTRDVDVDGNDASVKTTVKVGEEGPVSTTRTEIKGK